MESSTHRDLWCSQPKGREFRAIWPLTPTLPMCLCVFSGSNLSPISNTSIFFCFYTVGGVYFKKTNQGAETIECLASLHRQCSWFLCTALFEHATSFSFNDTTPSLLRHDALWKQATNCFVMTFDNSLCFLKLLCMILLHPTAKKRYYSVHPYLDSLTFKCQFYPLLKNVLLQISLKDKTNWKTPC